MHFHDALQMTRNFATQQGVLLGDLRLQVLHEPEGSWSFEFEDPVDPERMLWSAWVHPTGEVRVYHLPTDARLTEEPPELVSKLKLWLAKIWQAFVLSWSFAVIVGAGWRLYSRIVSR